MEKRLQKAVLEQKKQNEQTKLTILGTLGIPLGGQRLVEVPNRNSFVYVQLRSNQNEVIQAFNNKVAPSYGLPVIVQREGTRYIVLGVDSQRYQNNWNSFAPYLAKHGNTHSFDFTSGGGGDVVWVYSRQFMPLLTIPSGSVGGPNVVVSPHVLESVSGTWMYVGNTGTVSLLQYVPTGSNAVMVLIYLDRLSGNPYIVVNSGSYFANTITGTAEVTPYIPNVPNSNNHIPLSAIRLTTGTSVIGWDNIYDVRQFLQYITTGTGGGSSIDTLGFAGLYNGAPIGTGTFLNVRGDNVSFTKSGSMFDLFVTGSAGGSSIDTIGFAGLYEGSPLGTGTFLNVRGSPAVFTRSGSMFDLFLTGTTSTQVSSVGMMAWDEGIPLGTGTVFNFVGAGVNATISGTVINVNIPGGGGGGNIVGQHLGQYVATGTVINVRGGLTASGTFLEFNAQKNLVLAASAGFASTAVANWANMPAADTAAAASGTVILTDLTGFSQARLYAGFGAVAPATSSGTYLHMKYGIGSGPSFQELAVEPDVNGHLVWRTSRNETSGWFNIVPQARVDDVWLQLWGTGGNGAADPNFGAVGIEFR